MIPPLKALHSVNLTPTGNDLEENSKKPDKLCWTIIPLPLHPLKANALAEQAFTIQLKVTAVNRANNVRMHSLWNVTLPMTDPSVQGQFTCGMINIGH